MEDRAVRQAGQCSRSRRRVAWRIIPCLALTLASLAVGSPAIAAPADDLRATFERFVAAQNAHDLKAVGDLLMEPPSFSGSPVAPQFGDASKH